MGSDPHIKAWRIPIGVRTWPSIAICTLCVVFVTSRLTRHPPDLSITRDGHAVTYANHTFAYLAELDMKRELIVTSSTCGYMDMTLNWIEQLRSIGASNYLVIAEDLPSYEYLMSFAPRHTLPSYLFGRPFSRAARKAASFDSPDFKMCSRPYYLGELIRQNFSAVWIDSDVALLKNPFDVLRDETHDVVLVDDDPKLEPIRRHPHYYCSCFVFVRPSRAADALLSTWAHLCGNRTQNQLPLNDALDLLGGTVPWKLMPKELYPCGFDAERLALTNAPGWESPAWIHANWRVGGEAKEQFLSRFGLWRNLRASINCGD